MSAERPANRLLYGDCLTNMRDMAQWCVDLIYLDPPFNSNCEYSSIYKDETGRPLPAQIEAFCDMWTLDAEREQAIRIMPVLMREAGIDDQVTEFWRTWMNALRNTNPRLLAYLSYMVERLIVMKRILKPTGAVFLHCDPTASHYIKVMLDSIFGHGNFRSEIIWKRTSAHSSARRPGPVHDVIFYYTAGSEYTWNSIYQPYDADYIAKEYRHRDERGQYRVGDLTGPGTRHGESGQSWGGYDPTERGRHWAPPRSYPDLPASTLEALTYLDEQGRIHWPIKKDGSRGAPAFKRYLREMPGVAVQDVWSDIKPLNSRQRLGYATEKPVKLLERIIEMSSNPDDVVFDPFCGCGTSLEAAHRLGRRWIGIDIAIHAVKRVAKVRLEDRCGLVEGRDFTVSGVPETVEGARDLWKRDPYHFQRWAVEQVDGFVTTKRTADGGVDGRLYFDLPGRRDFASMAIEVKGGKAVTIAAWRALRGVLEADDAEMAGLIIMEPLKPIQDRNFAKFAADAGALEVHGTEYPRMQVLSVTEILEGKRFHTPSVVGRGSDQLELAGASP